MLVKIPIDPVLVTIGGLKIHWYGIMIAIGLYVSTIYLRMHYVVDIAAGFAVAALAVAVGPRLERWWHRPAPAIMRA